MKCQFCGGEIPDTAVFCIHCGQRQNKPASEPVKPAFGLAPEPEPAKPAYDASQVMVSLGGSQPVPEAPKPSFRPEPSFQPEPEPIPEPEPSFQPSFQPTQIPEPEPVKSSFQPEPSFQPQQSFQTGSFQPVQEPQNNFQTGSFQPVQEPQNNFQTGSFQPQNSFQPQQGNFQPQQGGFQPQQGNFQPQQGSFQPQQGGYQPQQGGYQPQNNFQQGGFQPGGYEPEQPKKKKGKAGLIIGIIAALLDIAAVVVLLVVKPFKPKMVDVNLNDYATMTFDGNSGKGTYTFSFDSTKFVKDNEDTIKWMDKKNATENAPAYDYYLYCVDGTFSGGENGKLKNGDTVTVTWKINEEWAPFFNVNVAQPSKTFTVEGLPEIEELDPFNGFELSFEGTSPYIDAYGDSSRVPEAFQYLQYKIEPQYDLSEGDTVTVTLLDWNDQDPTAQLEAEFGVHPITTSKTYTVIAGGTYVTSASQIPQEEMDYLIEIGQMIYQQDEVDAGNVPSNVTVKNFEYAGNLFLTLKEPDYYSTNNALFCLYKVDITVTYKVKEKDGDSEKEVEKTMDYTYYYDVEYDDLILLSDGTINIDDLWYYTPSDSFSTDKGDVTLYGYTSVETYLASFENAGLDAYTIENNIK